MKKIEATDTLVRYGDLTLRITPYSDEAAEKTAASFGTFVIKMAQAKHAAVESVKTAVVEADEDWPESTSRIEDYESRYKQLKTKIRRLTEDVKPYIDKLREIEDALRQPTKFLEAYAKEYEKALIELKLKAKAEEERIKNIQAERSRVARLFHELSAEYIGNSLDRAKKAFEALTTTLMSRDNSPKTPEALAAMVTSIAREPRFSGGKYFREKFMKVCNFVYTRPDEYPELDFEDVEIKALDVIRKCLIDNAYEWAVAHFQGTEAVVKQETVAAIEAAKDSSMVEAEKAQFTYTDPDIVTSGKLKTLYEIDLPETPDNAMFVVMKFLQYRNLMMEKMSGLRRPFTVTIERMKKYLEELVNDEIINDPDFKLKEVHKI